jgi:hypothetical protein
MVSFYVQGLVRKSSPPKATTDLEPITYRGALLSTLLPSTVYEF